MLLIFLTAMALGAIHSAIGMGYGTILSPLLILLGYAPLNVIPTVLLSQAACGLSGAMRHHKHGNVDFSPKSTDAAYIYSKLCSLGYIECIKRGFTTDFKVSGMISSVGAISVIFAAIVAISVPLNLLKMYIGILVMLMGLLILTGKQYEFSWRKIAAVSVISAFNKGLSGAGFGVITTGGQIMGGRSHKNAIACTVLAGLPIGIIGFLTYALLIGTPSAYLLAPAIVGAIVGGRFGPLATKNLKPEKLKNLMGIAMISLGILILARMILW